MTEKKRFVVDAFWSTAYSILSRIGAFIFIILLTRFVLTPSEFGLYTLALSIASFIFLFVDLGLNQTISTTLARYIDRDPEKARSYFRVIFGIKMLLGLLFFGVIVTFSSFISNTFGKPELLIPLIFASLFTLLLSILAFFDTLVFVRSKIKHLFIREIVLQVIRFLGILGLVMVGYTSSLLIKTFSILIISILGSFFVLIWLLRKDLKNLCFGKKSPIDLKSVIKEAILISLGTLALLSFTYIDVIMLGFSVPNEYIGFYRAAMALVGSLTGLLSFSGITMPLFSRNDLIQNTQSFKKIMRIISVIAIPATVGLAFFSREIIQVVYGSSYEISGQILFYLSFAMLFLILSNVLFSLFVGIGKTKLFTKFAIITLVFGIIANGFAIYFGRTSLEKTILVSLATTVSWGLLVVLLLLFLVRWKIYLPFKPLVKISISSGIMLIILWLVKSMLTSSSLLILSLLILLGALIYFLSLYLLQELTREDFHFLF